MSEDSSYYVYALKDSRSSPALTFYVGKGVGTRSHDHLLKPDATRKGERIKEILASGGQVLVSRLVDAITESQAIKLEAELISALGTVDSEACSQTRSCPPVCPPKCEPPSLSRPA